MAISLSIVAAMAQGRVIGIDNRLPWHLPSDLRRFKALTFGKPMIMGRKTFAAIGRPLPGRTSIVLTRTGGHDGADHVILAADIAQALEIAAAEARRVGGDEIMVIGGAEIFAALLPRASRMYLTFVDLQITGDTCFPDFEPADWAEVSRDSPARAPDDDAAFTFVDLIRRRPVTPL